MEQGSVKFQVLATYLEGGEFLWEKEVDDDRGNTERYHQPWASSYSLNTLYNKSKDIFNPILFSITLALIELWLF